MSPLGSGKKIGLAVGLVVVLAVAGFGAIRHIESTAEEHVRSLLASSKVASAQAGDISYSLLSGRLELKNLNISFTDADGVRQKLAAASLELEGVNRSLGDMLHNAAKASVMADIADAARLHDFTVVVDEPDTGYTANLTGKVLSVTDLHIDTAFIAQCLGLAEASEALSLKAGYALAYGESRSEDMKMTVSGKGLPPSLHMTIASAVSKGCDRGSLQESVVNGIRMRIDDREAASLGTFRLADITLPPYEVMLAVDRLNTEPMSDEEFIKKSPELFESILLGEKPLVGSMELTDLRMPDADVSLKNLIFKNTSTRPLDVSLAVNGLSLPLNISPYTARLGLLGYKRLDVSQAFNLSVPTEGGPFTFSTDLNAEHMLKGTFTLQGELPAGKIPDVDWTSFKIALLDASWTDEGLLPRAAAANQRLTGMSPATTLQFLEDSLQTELADAASTPAEQILVRNLAAKIMAFAGRPGTLRVTFKPERPVTLDELERLSSVSPFTVTVQEGTQTLEEKTQAVLDMSERESASE